MHGHDSADSEEPSNQEFGPIIGRALERARALLPPDVDIVHDLSHGHARVRCDAAALENVFASACVLAWQAAAGHAGHVPRIVVETSEMMMDEVVLNADAETLQGGLPPRRFLNIIISNDRRQPPGPLHIKMRPPAPAAAPPSARRLRLVDMRSVVEEHKGTFSVANDPSLGTGFDIFLPTAAPLDRQAVSGSGSAVRHVVYVDDYSGMRELIEEVLPDAGFRVTSFDRAMPALTFLQTGSTVCDAVVSDYKLIDLDGLELLKQVKRLFPDMPVVIVSGYVDDTLRARALERGAAAVLSKTQDLDTLCEVLHQLLPPVAQPEAASFTDWSKL